MRVSAGRRKRVGSGWRGFWRICGLRRSVHQSGPRLRGGHEPGDTLTSTLMINVYTMPEDIAKMQWMTLKVAAARNAHPVVY